MAAASSLAASSAFSSLCIRGSSERHECVRGLFTSSPSECKFVRYAGWAIPQRGVRGRLNPLWRRLSSPVKALDAGKETSAVSGVDGQQTWPIPQTIEEAIEQASGAVQRALSSGKRRQKLQLLLPVDQRQFNYLDTEPRDYPCGIGEEYLACAKMVGKILQAVSPSAKIEVRRIGEVDNEMDPVGLVYPSNKSIAAVVFPIAESLKQVRAIASKEENRPLLMINPQWRSSGQVVSDFGFGPWRRQAEEFVNSFENTYTLIEQRVGEASNVTSSSGGVVRILKCYPGDWQVHLMSSDGTDAVIGVFPAQPTYKEIETAVKEGRIRNPWKAAPRILGGSEPAPPPLPKSLSGALSDAQIEAMDTAEVRRALMALNLPSSGRMSTLKERLKEAQRNS
ncbi:hypothetical protein KC19_5G050400 [Ceratodon purpureus]|uniref:DUF1995 domain-containing protein n=1 Tax=Ceratodon purpureus TaxID=3225 RepID=A0A8T0HY13_CERPU|nr:hypothetical protein KC19_5G050400 [Ceratodon purpureus]